MTSETLTTTFDKFEEFSENNKLSKFNKELIKLLRLQELRTQYLEKQIRDLRKAASSRDDELAIVSDTCFDLKTVIENTLPVNPRNPIESSISYQEVQGLPIQSAPQIHKQSGGMSPMEPANNPNLDLNLIIPDPRTEYNRIQQNADGNKIALDNFIGMITESEQGSEYWYELFYIMQTFFPWLREIDLAYVIVWVYLA